MTVKKNDLKEMESQLKTGANISDIAAKYPKYDYWEVYWELSDYSFMGKKRMITNRLNKLKKRLPTGEREQLISEAQEYLDELYYSLKQNSSKLVKINQALQD